MANKGIDSRIDRLDRQEWLSSALEVLAKEGQAGMRIQGLCDALGVSRGSFYWHFEDWREFVDALLEYWHNKYTVPMPEFVEAGGGTGEEKLARIMRAVYEMDGTRYDMPIRAWAVQDTRIAKMVRRSDRHRLAYLRSLFTEMGFRGNELEVRTRACLSFMTLEKGLFDRLTQRARMELVDEFHAFFAGKKIAKQKPESGQCSGNTPRSENLPP